MSDLKVNAGQPPAQGEETFAALIAGEYDYTRPRRQEIRQAIVIRIDDSEVLVDLGTKRDGIVSSRDLQMLSAEYRSSLNVGDAVPVSVLDTSDRHDGILVSINKGLAQHDWIKAQEMLKSSETFEATVSDVNRGGVVVAFGRVRGFVPNSHLTSLPRGQRGEAADNAKRELIGKTLTLAVIEVNQHRRQLVLSERAAGTLRREQILQELQEGETRTGIVRNLAAFGAFVDIGGIDGLIHVSEMAWTHVAHPHDVLSVGDTVEVYVLSIDRERQRIGLSRKRLLPDPWSLLTEELGEGEVVEGVVTSVVSFGAFVEVRQGIEGLIHTSEMPDGDETHTHLKVGQPITVRVVNIDPWRRRIALSLLHVVQTQPWPDDADNAPLEQAPEDVADSQTAETEQSASRED